MFDKNVHHDDKRHQISKRTERRDPEHFRRHIRGADDAGTDQERHDPQSHDDVADQSPLKLRQVICDLQIQRDLCLSQKILMHHVCHKGRNIQRLSE